MEIEKLFGKVEKIVRYTVLQLSEKLVQERRSETWNIIDEQEGTKNRIKQILKEEG